MIPSFTSPYTRANNQFRRGNIERRLGMNQQLNAWRQTPLLDKMLENQPQPIQPEPEASQAGPASHTSSISGGSLDSSKIGLFGQRPTPPVGMGGSFLRDYGKPPLKPGEFYDPRNGSRVVGVKDKKAYLNAQGGQTWMANPIGNDGTLYNTTPRDFTMGGGKTEGMVINGRPGGREPGTGYRPSPSSYQISNNYQPNEKNKLDSIYAGGGMSGLGQNPYSNSGYVDPFEPNSAFNAKTGSYFWRGK